mmetsp:Transcript_20030/g.41357  ORF Transcript_20030/g.41357 Transcript_20030/m.41357 type:complete len:110 (-) Transcript_20030:1336-1665(-)
MHRADVISTAAIIPAGRPAAANSSESKATEVDVRVEPVVVIVPAIVEEVPVIVDVEVRVAPECVVVEAVVLVTVAVLRVVLVAVVLVSCAGACFHSSPRTCRGDKSLQT